MYVNALTDNVSQCTEIYLSSKGSRTKKIVRVVTDRPVMHDRPLSCDHWLMHDWWASSAVCKMFRYHHQQTVIWHPISNRKRIRHRVRNASNTVNFCTLVSNKWVNYSGYTSSFGRFWSWWLIRTVKLADPYCSCIIMLVSSFLSLLSSTTLYISVRSLPFWSHIYSLIRVHSSNMATCPRTHRLSHTQLNHQRLVSN